MLEQGRLEPTLTAAREYGGEHPDEFGGLSWASDPTRVVFWATAHVAQHREALRSRVPHPDRVEVERCRHTERQIHAWLDEVYRRLDGRHQGLHVTSWGQGHDDEGSTVQVTIWPWSEEAAQRVRQELAPIPVQVDARRGAIACPPFRSPL
jgi:hypothetical protein